MKALRAEIDATLAPIGAKHDLVFKAGGATYALDGSNAKFQLKIDTLTADGTQRDPDADSFNLLCGLHGFKKTDLGREFNFRGKTYKLIGLNSKGRATPMSCKSADGRTYRFDTESILAAFALQDAQKEKAS